MLFFPWLEAPKPYQNPGGYSCTTKYQREREREREAGESYWPSLQRVRLRGWPMGWPGAAALLVLRAEVLQVLL